MKSACWFAITLLFVSSASPSLVAAATAGDSDSELPDPATTTFEGCLGRSPVNDSVPAALQYTFMGVLRDASGSVVNAVPAADVHIAIDAPCTNPVVIHPIGPSNPLGEVFWDASSLTMPGGSCQGSWIVRVVVQGLSFTGFDEARSPDQDGDGLVTLADLIVYQQAFVHQGPLHEGDLDCDGAIALADLMYFQGHFVAGP